MIDSELIQRLNKINVADSDVVVLTATGGMRPDQVSRVFNAVLSQYKERKLEAPIFTILQPGQTLETVDEDKMRDHGWVRALCPRCLTHG